MYFWSRGRLLDAFTKQAGIKIMKEIKYQIFHKPTKTIQVVAAIDFNNKVVDTYGIDEPIYGIPFGDVEWREYIGINDKNNDDIFTGDIVKSPHIPFTYVVEYFDGSFCLKDVKDGCRNYCTQDRMTRLEFQIIENKFQNIGLLNEK
jgi:hypothetical protein